MGCRDGNYVKKKSCKGWNVGIGVIGIAIRDESDGKVLDARDGIQ